jgi:chemotaxis protein methyltransferase CheR
VAKNGVRPSSLTDGQFARLRDLIEGRCGLFFGESRQTSLEAAVAARMEQLGLGSIDAYEERLRCEPADGEFRTLIHLVTITETCFLRDPAQFRLLRQHLIPSVLADRGRSGTRSVRIWSAGCSSGEEAYSVALTVRDMGLYETHSDWTFDIFGTDLNTEKLEAARRGVYGSRALRNVEGSWLRRFFEPSGRQFRLKDEIRRSVRFLEGNLTSDLGTGAPPGRADIILCKNVTIYFRPEVTRRLVERLHAALNVGGFLLLGHSESLWQMESGFTLIEHDGVFCYRKDGARDSGLGTRDSGMGVRGPRHAGQADAPANRARAFTPPCSTPAPVPAPPFQESTGQYERCLEAFRKDEWARAEADVRELIRSSPSFVPAQLLLGGLYAHRGRYAEAREQATRVLDLDDTDARAYLLLGMIDARAGNSVEAAVSLRRALYLDDALALGYFWLGNLYRDRGDVDRACAEHLELVRRHHQNTLDFTEEFASDLTPGQIVDACRQTVRRLRGGA